jgi:RNA polymerase sigma-70 factor, ECF subfamily
MKALGKSTDWGSGAAARPLNDSTPREVSSPEAAQSAPYRKGRSMVEVQAAVAEAGESAHDAFSTVIGRELSSAYRVAGYILADATEAQDAVQEAMERAWNGWPKLRNRDSAKAWFWRILTNVCRTRLSARKRSPIRDVSEHLEMADPLDPFLSSLLRDSVGRALTHLTPDQRIVIVLRFWGRLSMPEIAERLDIPEGTAKSRQHYGLETLRRALESDEEGTR